MASLLKLRVSTSAAKRFGWHGVRRGAARTVPRVGSGGLGGHFGPQEGGGEMEPGSGNIAEEQIVKEVMEKGYVRSVAMPYAERSTEREQGLKREGTVAPPGIIKKNMHKRLMEKDPEYASEQKEVMQEKMRELWEKRAARQVPRGDPEGMVEFLLDTESGEMPYEIGRCRPELDENFFNHLRGEIARLQKENPNSERLQELEGLLEVVEDGVKKLDERAQQVAAPKERLKKLLAADDKRDTLLQMISDNEVDKDLMELLYYNAVSAQSAGEEDKANVMQKLLDACRKYAVIQ